MMKVLQVSAAALTTSEKKKVLYYSNITPITLLIGRIPNSYFELLKLRYRISKTYVELVILLNN